MGINLDDLDDDVARDIGKNLIDDFDINNADHEKKLKEYLDTASVEDALERYMTWHGIIGYTGMFLDAFDSLTDSEVKDRE